LRIRDQNRSWRLVYRIDRAAIIAVSVFSKTTTATTAHDIITCKERLKAYDDALKETRKKRRP
jgi:phage-related protein